MHTVTGVARSLPVRVGGVVGAATALAATALWAGDGVGAALVLGGAFGCLTGVHAGLCFAGLTAVDATPRPTSGGRTALRIALAAGLGALAVFTAFWSWIVTAAATTGCLIHCDPDDRSAATAVVAGAVTAAAIGALGHCLALLFSVRPAADRVLTRLGLGLGTAVAVVTAGTARWW